MKINSNLPSFLPSRTTPAVRPAEIQDSFQAQEFTVLEKIQSQTRLSAAPLSDFLKATAGNTGLQLACPLLGATGAVLHLTNSDGRFTAALQQSENHTPLPCRLSDRGDSLMVGLPEGFAVLENDFFGKPKVTLSANQHTVLMTFQNGQVGDLSVMHGDDLVARDRSGRLSFKHSEGDQGFIYRSGSGLATHLRTVDGRPTQREATSEEIETLYQGALRTIAQLD